MESTVTAVTLAAVVPAISMAVDVTADDATPTVTGPATADTFASSEPILIYSLAIIVPMESTVRAVAAAAVVPAISMAFDVTAADATPTALVLSATLVPAAVIASMSVTVEVVAVSWYASTVIVPEHADEPAVNVVWGTVVKAVTVPHPPAWAHE